MDSADQPSTYERVPASASINRLAEPSVLSPTTGMRAFAHKLVSGPPSIQLLSDYRSTDSNEYEWESLPLSARAAIRRPNERYESWSIYEAYRANVPEQSAAGRPLFLVREAAWDNEADLAALHGDEPGFPNQRMSITAQTTDVSDEAASTIDRCLKGWDDATRDLKRENTRSIPAGDQFYLYLITDWGWIDFSWSAPTIYPGCMEIIDHIRTTVHEQFDCSHESRIEALRFRYDLA